MEQVRKRIWLINQYAMPPALESRLRTIKFAHYLKDKGYDVTIFGSSYMHNMNMDLIEDNSQFIERQYEDLNFVHVKTRKYHNNGFSRIIGLFEFVIKLSRICTRFPKPDIIIHTAGAPFSNLFYFRAKRLKAKYIVELLDLWPEGFVAFGLVKKNNLLLKVAYQTEKWLYKKADKVVFSMEGGRDYIIDKKWDKIHGGPIDLDKVYYLNNGIDLDDFYRNKKNYRIEDIDLEDSKTFKVIYLGSIRLVNNLKRLVDAAKLLKENQVIKFLIYGDGDDREYLEKYCKEEGIDNVIFKQKWIDPKYVPYVLSCSSLNILNYQANYIWKYGGSQSKLFQYLASGKPICSNLQMGYCLINKFDLGIARKFGSDQEYADAIKSIFELDDEVYNGMCGRAKVVAKEFDYKILTDKLVKIIGS